MRLSDQLDRLLALGGTGQPSASSEQTASHFFRSTSKAAIFAMAFSLRCSSFLRALISRCSWARSFSLLFHGQHWLVVGILSGLQPTFNLLLVQAPIPSVGVELGGVQSSGLELDREFVGSRPDISSPLGCRPHLSLQPPRLRPVVEDDHVNAQFS